MPGWIVSTGQTRRNPESLHLLMMCCTDTGCKVCEFMHLFIVMKFLFKLKFCPVLLLYIFGQPWEPIISMCVPVKSTVLGLWIPEFIITDEWIWAEQSRRNHTLTYWCGNKSPDYRINGNCRKVSHHLHKLDCKTPHWVSKPRDCMREAYDLRIQ